MDLRETIATLEKDGELHRVKAELNWEVSSAQSRAWSWRKRGPALLFEAIKDHRSTISTQFVTSILSGDARPRRVLGFAANPTNRELVQYVRAKNRQLIPPPNL